MRRKTSFERSFTAGTVLLACAFAPPIASLSACDKETKLDALVEASTTQSATANASAARSASAPEKPRITVDERGAMVDADHIDFSAPDPKAHVVAALAGKSLVEGETLEVVALRNAKTTGVALVLSALRTAKAKGATVKTAGRDDAMGSLDVAWLPAQVAPCSAVGFIGKDRAINAWPVGGGTAARFAKGMAGPDMTLGSGGVRKVQSACDSAVWFVGSDDTVEWGLAFDLALAVKKGDAAGPPRAREVVVLGEAPVPGRSVQTAEK